MDRTRPSEIQLAWGSWMIDGAASEFSPDAGLAQQDCACRTEVIGHSVAQHAALSSAAARAIPQPKPICKASAKARKIPVALRIGDRTLAASDVPAQPAPRGMAKMIISTSALLRPHQTCQHPTRHARLRGVSITVQVARHRKRRIC